MSQSRTIVGARVRCYINGRLLGRVSRFSFSSNVGLDTTYGIDSSLPFELAPTTINCTGGLSLYRLAGDGGVEGVGMTSAVQDILLQKYFTIMIVERNTDTIIFRADQCMLTSQSWDVAAGPGGRMSGNIQFQGISWNNES